MDPQQIKAFIDAMAASDLDEMEVGHDGWTLRLVRRGAGAGVAAPAARAHRGPAGGPAATAAVESAAARHGDVLAPLFGVVHLQQSPGEPPFVQAGQLIEAGQLVAVVEAMKVFNEVRAEQAGRIAAILVASGQEVEAGQSLLRFA